MRSAAALVVVMACGRGEAPAPPPAPIAATGESAAGDAATVGPCPVGLAMLAPGLTVERWQVVATPVAGGAPCVDVVRADLARYRLTALTDAEGRRRAPAWRDRFGLAAVTNAGMFHEDGAPVGLVIANGAPRGIDNQKMSGYLAWDPVSPGDPLAIVAGRDCAGFELAKLRERYRSLVQGYRFLGCDGRALPWQDPKQYSAAGIGVDRAGRVVFLHARAAFTMSELAAAIGAHDLAGAIFLEGGPEASLVVHGPAGKLERVGSYETNFMENDDNVAFWELPNIIGLEAR